jgi:hypothetical protein
LGGEKGKEREGVRLHRAWSSGLGLGMVSVEDVGEVALGGAVMMMSVGDVDEVALGELFTKLSPTLVNALSSNRTGLNGSALGFRVLNLDFFEFTREHAGACSSPCTSNSPPPPSRPVMVKFPSGPSGTRSGSTLNIFLEIGVFCVFSA